MELAVEMARGLSAEGGKATLKIERVACVRSTRGISHTEYEGESVALLSSLRLVVVMSDELLLLLLSTTLHLQLMLLLTLLWFCCYCGCCC